MPGKYLLDTNAAIALLNGDSRIAALLVGADVFLPSIAVGELYYGACNSSRVSANVVKVETFIAANVVVGVDSDTSRAYGNVKAALRRKGRPIPDNDLWIAAIAIQYAVALATRDAHFGQVEGITVTAW